MKTFASLSLLLFSMLLAGCASHPKVEATPPRLPLPLEAKVETEETQKIYYTFDEVQSDGILDCAQQLIDRAEPFYIRVLPFRAESIFTNATLSTRLPGHRRQFLDQHEFLEPPAVLLTTQFRQMFNKQLCEETIVDEYVTEGSFDIICKACDAMEAGPEDCAVLDNNVANVKVSHFLDAIINEIGGDFSNPEKPAAILSISLWLIQAENHDIRWQHTYNLATSITDPTPEAIVHGLNVLVDYIRFRFQYDFDYVY